jgi:hypothetical protein
MSGKTFRALAATLLLVAASPAYADLPLDKYQDAVKDSATNTEAQAFLNGYFIGLAAGLGQLDIARQNPKTVNFCLPDQLPLTASQLRTLVDRGIASGAFAQPPASGGSWDMSIVARMVLGQVFPCPPPPAQ